MFLLLSTERHLVKGLGVLNVRWVLQIQVSVAGLEILISNTNWRYFFDLESVPSA